MANNKSLARAKDAKNDEFYTQISDIEKELKYYKAHFKNKIVFCNCDDPDWSNFWKYFHLNFEHLGLKKLVTTHYDASEPTYMMEYEGGNDADTSVGKITPLKQNGDFRSPECLELLNQSDIVVTNPPFSLFREYIGSLIESDKKFLILGNMNASHYKEIFPLIQDDLLWFGYTAPKEFAQPDGTIKKFGNILWYTNLDIVKRHEVLDLIEKYDPEKYPKYENYSNCIEVAKVNDIPCDYDGLMGVPDGFLNVYNPEQFEIIGYGRGDFLPEIDTVPVELLESYRKAGGRGHITAGMKSLCYYDSENNAKFPYSRIIIRKRRKG